MKRRAFVGLFAFLWCLGWGERGTSAQASVIDSDVISGRFIAEADPAQSQNIRRWAQRNGVKAEAIRGSDQKLWVIEHASALSLEQIQRSSIFESVDEDFWLNERPVEYSSGLDFSAPLNLLSVFQGNRPNDVAPGANWALERIHAPMAWTHRTSTDSVVIAVLDSGVEVDHPDLAQNIWVNEDEVPGNGVDDDHNGWVDDVHGYDAHFERVEVRDEVGHGTNLAGIIGSVGNNGIGTSGVAWNTRMMVVRGDDARRMSWTGAVKGAYYARDNGARVINASWGSYSATTGIRTMLEDMEKSGVMVVNAVGNNSNNVDTEHRAYPAGFATSNLIVVTALHPNNSLVHYADYGPKYVHLAAPGWGVPTTFLKGRYGTQAGSSVAAPYVTAAVALVWAEHPEWTHEQVKNQILSTVDVLPTLQGKVGTSGVLNLARALGVASD